jgi:hypothetical protein
MSPDSLDAFIVRAKAVTYVGGGVKVAPSRPGSHDLTFAGGDWSYRDSYFGGTDFLGQETVWLKGEPVWAMNYYGYILRPELIDAVRAGSTIKAAFSAASISRGRTASIRIVPRATPRISTAPKPSPSPEGSPIGWIISAGWFGREGFA